jgi:hypothetical protein
MVAIWYPTALLHGAQGAFDMYRALFAGLLAAWAIVRTGRH